jgi:tellurite methyltransferase
MTLNGFQWSNFYKNISGREPRELVVDVVGRFAQEPSANPRTAIDLGCGDGTETAFLLENGWHVLAIDGEPTAFEHLNPKIPPEAQERLQTQISKFETVELGPVDLIYAGFSIPFCNPQHFDALWHKIVDNIHSGGRFAGQLFGVNDTWASNTEMTFFTAEQAQALFADFEVEYFREEDADGQSSVGAKHWHVFHVIARKK